MSIVDQIVTRYEFPLPKEYLDMNAKGWFDISNGISIYLWIPECEWLSLEQILNYKFNSYQKAGFVPFGFTGSGDLWCWHPEVTNPSGTPIVNCPHDGYEGEYDSHNFLGSIYHRILEYSLGGIDLDEEDVARQQLRRYARDLKQYFPSSWIATLESLSYNPFTAWSEGKMKGTGLISYKSYKEVVQQHLSFPLLGQKIEWMNES
jgi:hypothetical protein